MQRQITLIRDIDKIEEYLKPAKTGILALNCKDEKLVQLVTPFLYRDKNVFISLENDDELLEKIIYSSISSFVTVYDKNPSADDGNYNIIHITLNGQLRIVDEQKVADEIILSLQKKYNESETEPNKKYTVLILDTEEIQAAEESGG